jgi:hypothetical protein
MEFGNHYYYEITVRQHHKDLLSEAEASRLLKQAGLLPEKGIAWPMVGVNLTVLWRKIRWQVPLVQKP